MKFTTCRNTNEARAMILAVFVAIAEGGYMTKDNAAELLVMLGRARHLLDTATPSQTMIDVTRKLTEACHLLKAARLASVRSLTA